MIYIIHYRLTTVGVLQVCYTYHYPDTSVSMGCEKVWDCVNATAGLACRYGEEMCSWCCHTSRCNMPFLYPPYVPEHLTSSTTISRYTWLTYSVDVCCLREALY